MNKVKRNDPCPCGSGKKYKKCCGQKKSFSTRSFVPLSGERVQSKVNSLITPFSPSEEKSLRGKITSEPPKKPESDQGD